MIRQLSLSIVFFTAGLSLAFGQSGLDTAPGGSSMAGAWQGAYSVPGSAQALSFNLVALPQGSYAGTLDLPQQKLRHVPVQVREVAGTDSVYLLVPAVKSVLLARRSAEGDELRGLWHQPGLSKQVTLCLSELPATTPAAQAAAPYEEEEVVINNPLARLRLAGTLTMPAGTGPYPAVVLISDLGEQNRDGQAAGSADDFRLLGALGDYLSRHSVAVLRLDDRGVGGSEGRNNQTTPVQRAADVEAALNYLRTRPEIDLLHLGLIGHGEGASVAMLVAAQPLPPAFVVGLGAYGLTGYDTLLAQLEAKLLTTKLPPEEQELRLRRQAALYDLIRYSTNRSQTHGAVANMLSQNDPTLSLAVAQQQAMLLLTPWHRSFLAFNPLECLPQVHCPVLLISGRADAQAPPASHLDLLERELRSTGNRQVTVLRPAGVNHLLQPPPAQWTLLDGRMQPVLAPAVAEGLLKWLSTQAWDKEGDAR